MAANYLLSAYRTLCSVVLIRVQCSKIHGGSIILLFKSETKRVRVDSGCFVLCGWVQVRYPVDPTLIRGRATSGQLSTQPQSVAHFL